MDRNHLPPAPCGAYDARHIASVLRYLTLRVQGLDPAGRQELLATASRLPGLPGRFVQLADKTIQFKSSKP